MNAELVKKKIVDYKLDDFEERLMLLIQNIPGMVTDGAFKKEMRRFLPNDVYERTLDKEKFERFLVGSLQKLFEGLKKEFYGGDASTDFIM